MVSSRLLTLASAFLTLAVAPVSAAPISSVYKVVRSGALAPMGFHYDLDDDCRSPGPVVINLVTPPSNGDISEGPRSRRLSYGAGRRLAACNGTKVRGLEIYYRSAPGYTGPDSYVVERVFPNGDAQRFRIGVSVR